LAVSGKIQESIERSSWIRKMFEEGEERRAKFGAENVFDFSLGNPNLEPPLRFKQVLAELANDAGEGLHAYMPNAGFTETRQAVCDYLNRFNSPNFTPDEIVMTVGAGGGLNVVLKTLLDPGDEVIIPSYVCMALLNAVRLVQAIPVIADVHPETYNIDPDDAQDRITGMTKAIIVPHMFGLPADIRRLLEFGIPVIEDCAQSVGVHIGDTPVGCMGLISIYSFYATKMMTTGEGGMVASRSKALIDRVKDLRDYDHAVNGRLRYNYKMTDMQAAMGNVQLGRLDFFIKRRRDIAKAYNDSLNKLAVKLPGMYPCHVFFRYIIDLGKGKDAQQWVGHLIGKGVRAEKPVYRPIHQYMGLKGYPNSEDLMDRLISVPIYPKLSDHDTKLIVQALQETSKEIAGNG